MNIFSDHGAFVLYPLSCLYRIVASPYLLLSIQSLALSCGVIPIAMLGRWYGLSEQRSFLAATVYLLHPVVFNTNLFDFHPETIGVPLLPLIILYAERRCYMAAFAVAVFIMSCKEVLALVIAALAISLVIKRHTKFGLVLAVLALAWFAVLTQYIMPGLPYGALPNAFGRYAFLGHTFTDKLTTLLLRPNIVLQYIDPYESAVYITLLIMPCFWVLGRRSLPYVVALMPIVFLNTLSDLNLQRSLRLQYSLPLIPILALMAVERLRSLATERQRWSEQVLLCWGIFCFVVPPLAGNIRTFGDYPVSWAPLGSVATISDGVLLVPENAKVLASARFVPHLSHRQIIRAIDPNEHLDSPHITAALGEYDYVVVDTTEVPDLRERATNGAVLRVLKESDSCREQFASLAVVVYACTQAKLLSRH
jgi:uncharacterized membrane protein